MTGGFSTPNKDEAVALERRSLRGPRERIPTREQRLTQLHRNQNPSRSHQDAHASKTFPGPLGWKNINSCAAPTSARGGTSSESGTQRQEVREPLGLASQFCRLAHVSPANPHVPLPACEDRISPTISLPKHIRPPFRGSYNQDYTILGI